MGIIITLLLTSSTSLLLSRCSYVLGKTWLNRILSLLWASTLAADYCWREKAQSYWLVLFKFMTVNSSGPFMTLSKHMYFFSSPFIFPFSSMTISHLSFSPHVSITPLHLFSADDLISYVSEKTETIGRELPDLHHRSYPPTCFHRWAVILCSCLHIILSPVC